MLAGSVRLSNGTHVNLAMSRPIRIAAEQIDLIAAAMLAANNFPLLRSQEIVPALRRVGLLDPETASKLDLGPWTVKLAAAGYDRGMLTSMFAERLRALMQAVCDGVLDELPDAIATGDETKATNALTRVKGIGPTVSRTAWALLRSVRNDKR